MLERLTDEFLVLVSLASGLAVTSIGLASVIGYITGWVLFYQWSRVPMAANSAVACFLIGVALVSLSIVNLRRVRGSPARKAADSL